MSPPSSTSAPALRANPGEFWVLHRGALGDSILLWPMLRKRAAEGWQVILVTDRSKAVLAGESIGIGWQDIEQSRFNDLWRAEAAISPVESAAAVLTFLPGPAGPRDGVFLTNLDRMFPRAEVGVHRARPDAIFARSFLGDSMMPAEIRRNPGGPILCHVGAGAAAKRWPLERFLALAARLRGAYLPELIAGEVELEKFSASERSAFEQAGGRIILDLPGLAAELRRAACFIGNDSGPSHLAAQLGIPSLALFGPSDPAQWGPVGPAVQSIAPDSPEEMAWLSIDVVEAALRRLVRASITA